MGADFAIELEPREVVASDVSDAEVAAYYREHLAPGTPPLEQIRDHVARAVALSRITGAPDPTEGLHRAFVDAYGRDRIWWDPDLGAAASRLEVTPLGDFQVADPRWCSAADGLRTVRALQRFLREAHPDRSDQLACLALVEEILVHAERDQRGWRLLVLW